MPSRWVKGEPETLAIDVNEGSGNRHFEGAQGAGGRLLNPKFRR
jgi:hypothetical protein